MVNVAYLHKDLRERVVSWMGSALALDLTFHLKLKRSRPVLHIQMLTLKHRDPSKFHDSFVDNVLDTEHGLLQYKFLDMHPSNCDRNSPTFPWSCGPFTGQ